ncbi:coiled-coil domain-containing protein [Aquibacillus kalidii]|uniref:YhgE/Pip domain-containing protein n=1 Tax=Aquibacillus kalidii TaxID=2762597 RepID=UPI001647FCBB|nr:YhgE/Pip domain-containing protein [Aquibacillus kalidii]
MRRIRKILLVFITFILVLPSLLVSAESEDSVQGEKGPQGNGQFSSKEEVVYAKLNATGERQEIYVVNILNMKEAGKIVDYGPYTSLKNLTNLSPLEQTGNKVEINAPEGKFYYQGNLNEQPLPWDISITYLLDGKEVSPTELAGKGGHVEIRIATSANDAVDRVFFENYLLQISLSLNLDNYHNIEAPEATLANAGKNKQVSFTVMPEKEEELVLEADVEEFELDGIDISAVPSSMPIDSPNIEEMTGEMEMLTDAIDEINNGVGKLENGVSELNSGATSLRGGSAQYRDGIAAINASSSELVNGSKQIKQALEKTNASLANSSEEIDLSGLQKLGDGLGKMAKGLKGTADGLGTLKDKFATAYSTLDKAIGAIPAYELSKEQAEQLQKSNADQEVIGKLLETYKTARTAKETYAKVQVGFDAVGTTLDGVNGSLLGMVKNLEGMASELATAQEDMDVAESLTKLKEGLGQLASQYGTFHSGLVEYTGGVSQLSSNYAELDHGIASLSQGTGELENGVNELHNGTAELDESTSNLPEQMKKEVNQMMEEYDKSDFKAVSFVSPKNVKINSVQFVLKTESIKVEEKEKTKEPVEEEKGFWARLLDLF